MRRLLAIVTVPVFLLASCGDAEPSSPSGSDNEPPDAEGTVCETTDAADDLLAEICDKGVLTVSTDPAYPPQSKYVPKKDEYVGFDIDVATEIATRLGVEVAWETPSWDVITAGSWNGRWQMSVGSMTPTNDRQQVLNFTQPYYFTPAVGVVHEDNTGVATSPPTSTARPSACAPAAPTSSTSTRRSRSRASPSTSSSTTPRSRATTPTPRRCRTSRSATAPGSMPPSPR